MAHIINFNLRRFCFFVFALLFVSSAAAQVQNDFVPQDTLSDNDHTYSKIDEYKTFLDNTTQAYAATLDKRLQKEYTKIINEKNVDMVKALKEKGFVFDNTIYPYVSSVFYSILEKNSIEKNQFHFFVSRSSEVNAYTYEDGTIICNLGLLNIIQNESQLTMVFCHELGHHLLHHVNNKLVKQLEALYSDEMKEQLKEIKKGEYNTKEQLEDVLMSNVFNNRKHSRSQEAAADSLGLLLFSKTGYGGTSLPHIFDLLDSSADPIAPCTIRDFLKKENITANADWFKTTKKMSFGVATAKEIVDSLKTHPDCPKRKIAAEHYFDLNPKPGPDFLLSNRNQLMKVNDMALFDEAIYAKDNQNLGSYLYRLIQNDTLFPSNKFIKTEIFNTLLALCINMKKHSLYKVVSTPYIADSNNDEYAKLLKLLDAISLKELIGMTSDYYEKEKLFINTTNDSINNLNQLKSTQL